MIPCEGFRILGMGGEAGAEFLGLKRYNDLVISECGDGKGGQRLNTLNPLLETSPTLACT